MMSNEIDRAARLALAEIVEDVRSGVYPEDTVLGSFSVLHDHVDANMYAYDIWQHIDSADEQTAFVNDLQDRIDDFLKRHPITVVEA